MSNETGPHHGFAEIRENTRCVKQWVSKISMYRMLLHFNQILVSVIWRKLKVLMAKTQIKNVAKETMETEKKNNEEVLFSATYTRFLFQTWNQ